MIENNLSAIIKAGLNNPECAFFTGQMIGQMNTLGMVFMLVGSMLAFKLVGGLIDRGMALLKKALKEKTGGEKNG